MSRARGGADILVYQVASPPLVPPLRPHCCLQRSLLETLARKLPRGEVCLELEMNSREVNYLGLYHGRKCRKRLLTLSHLRHYAKQVLIQKCFQQDQEMALVVFVFVFV